MAHNLMDKENVSKKKKAQVIWSSGRRGLQYSQHHRSNRNDNSSNREPRWHKPEVLLPAFAHLDKEKIKQLSKEHDFSLLCRTEPVQMLKIPTTEPLERLSVATSTGSNSQLYYAFTSRMEKTATFHGVGAPDAIVDDNTALFELHEKGPGDHLRSENLRKFILGSNEYAVGDLAGSLVAGFKRMDEFLESQMDSSLNDLSWRTGVRSGAVFIRDKTMLVAGAGNFECKIIKNNEEINCESPLTDRVTLSSIFGRVKNDDDGWMDGVIDLQTFNIEDAVYVIFIHGIHMRTWPPQREHLNYWLEQGWGLDCICNDFLNRRFDLTFLGPEGLGMYVITLDKDGPAVTNIGRANQGPYVQELDPRLLHMSKFITSNNYKKVVEE